MSTTTPRVDDALVPCPACRPLRWVHCRRRERPPGPMALGALDREQSLPAQRVTADDDRAARPSFDSSPSVTRVDARDGRPRCPRSASTERWRSGLVAAERDAIVALADVRPYATDGVDHRVASDLPNWRPVDRSPRTTCSASGRVGDPASWTRDRPSAGRWTGTGCGIQASTSPPTPTRSSSPTSANEPLAYAAFNAALNSVDWQIRGGSMLEPVAGEQFSLIVSNPPFVITPRSGMFPSSSTATAGPAVTPSWPTRPIDRRAEPGGIAQFLGNWEVPAGAPGRTRWAAGWRHGPGCPGHPARGPGPGGVRRDMGA